jgi:hypothetical protein
MNNVIPFNLLPLQLWLDCSNTVAQRTVFRKREKIKKKKKEERWMEVKETCYYSLVERK